MGIRAEATVAEQDVTGLQFAREPGRLRHVVSPHRAGRHAQEHAGGRIEQGDDMAHREPTTGTLSGRRSEVALEFGDVRHREAGAGR